MSLITGAHVVVHSTDPEADRAFFRDVLDFPNVDAGDGWLIFALPPSEVAFHPSAQDDRHELYLLCDNVDGFVERMAAMGIACGSISDQSWGRVAELTLPGGGTLGVYQPRHERPQP